MAIVPKRKTSKQRKRTRKAQDKLIMPNLVDCTKCKKKKEQHRVCVHCGFYKDRMIIKVKEK